MEPGIKKSKYDIKNGKVNQKNQIRLIFKKSIG